ncbi:MAG: hypothetical protein INF91_07020 [Alphaproteobacteria bacterium]|nr:hypothetical protein [Alphaproteobacteria bacterium]
MKASGWLGTLGVVAVLAGAAWAVVDRGPLGRKAEVGVGYAARVVCACRYIGNRTMAQCLTDFEPGMEIVSVTEDAAAKRITATVPLIATRTARYDGDLGCALDE